MQRIIVISIILTMFLQSLVAAQDLTKQVKATYSQPDEKVSTDVLKSDISFDASQHTVDSRPIFSDRIINISPFVGRSIDDDLAIVDWSLDEIRKAAKRRDRSLIKNFPLHNNLSVDLDVRPFSITSSKTRVVMGRKGQPDVPLAYDTNSISFFRGSVKGKPGSSVFLALGPRSSTGFVDLGASAPRYLISSKDRNGQPYSGDQLSVFRARQDGSSPYPAVPKCGLDGSTINIKKMMDRGESQDSRATTAGTPVLQKGLKHIELAVETDYDYYFLFNDPIAATDYVMEAYAAISDIYIRDVNAYFEIVYIRLWNQPNDLFNGSDPLTEFRLYWQANMGAVARDSAFFFSGRRDMAFGGIAYLNALCSSSAYGVAGYILGYFPDPTLPNPYQWDVGVTAHELGHNSGTGHTQDYNVDQCQDPSTVPKRGTIMSYCSQTWSGGNSLEDNYFHTRIQQNIESFINTASCLATDCNMNNISDLQDIFTNFSADTNSNNIPDECEDCNGNSILDPVDIAGPTSQDLNNNTIPDECEPDCNNNGVPDDRDILLNTSTDAYGNGIPDECEEDCNNNGTSDYTEIQLDITLDINRDAILDSCQDCDSDGTIDLIDISSAHHVWAARGSPSTPISEFEGVVGVEMNISSGGSGSLVDQAQDLIISSTGRIFVSSAGDDRVMEFDLSGNYVGNFVSPGSGGLNYPTGLLLMGGQLLVSSQNNHKVIAYSDVDGTLIGDFIAASSGGLKTPFGLTRGPNGNIYVTSGLNEVLEFDGATGSFVSVFVSAANNGTLDQPRGLVFKPDGNLLVSSYGSNEVLEFEAGTGDPLGKWAQVGTPTVLNQVSPWGIRIGPNGGVYVARTGDAFGSGGALEDHHEHEYDHGRILNNVSQSHLTKARVYEYDVSNGYLKRAFIAGNDFGLSFPTAFDFVPGWSIDCNFNRLQDSCDIASGYSLDVDTNGIPDECEIDCNSNTVQDRLDIIPYGDSYDCNNNLIPDECDLASLTSADCNNNGVPDECDPDCNQNGIPDGCDKVICFGSCCDGITCIENVAEETCDGLIGGPGLWYNGLQCDDIDCTGACCAAGECTDNVSQTDCDDIDGTWNGGELCINSSCNIQCDSAMTMVCGDILNIDNSMVTNPANPSYSCGFGTSHDGTVWLKFVATGSAARLISCNSVQQDSAYAIYDGTCGSLVQLGCSEDDCGPSGFLGDLTVNSLTPGNTYYIQFSAWQASDRGSFTLELDCGCNQPDPIIPEPIPISKSRYLTIDPDVPGNAGQSIAIRVRLQDLDGFGGFNNEVRWVGPPNEYQEGVTPTPTFIAGGLQCVPHYQDWTGVDLMHVYGDAVVPGSDYQVQAIYENCDVNDESNYSSVLPVNTGKWGDIVAPFDGFGGMQPSVGDILSLVDKWLGNVDPIKARAQLRPNIPDPSQAVDVAGILLDVDAWLGSPYPFDGPSACP